MDITSQVLLDANMYDFELTNKIKINTNRYFNDVDTLYPKMLTIYIEEYDLSIKKEKQNSEKKEEKVSKKEKKTK